MPKRKFTKKRVTLERLATMVAQGFDETNARFDETNARFALVASKKELEELKADIRAIRNEMVTKAYLDDKLADLEGSVMVRQRKEDHKVNLLIDFLKKKKVLGKSEVKMLQEIQVFPTLSRK